MVMDKLYNETKERLSNKGEIDPEMSELEVSAKVIWNLRDTISIDQVSSLTNDSVQYFLDKILQRCPTCMHIFYG